LITLDFESLLAAAFGSTEDKFRNSASATAALRVAKTASRLLIGRQTDAMRDSASMLDNSQVAKLRGKLDKAACSKFLLVSTLESRLLKFPLGHPRDGVVYIGHPAVANLYYPMADFHRVIFEHKFCEAISLLMSLRARQMRVEHVTGWSREFLAGLSLPLPTDDLNVGAGGHSSSRRSLLYEASLSGTGDPKIPDGLVWYHHEPTWQSVASGRLDFGLDEFRLTVASEDDFGIDARLKTVIGGCGLDLGGRFEDHRSTIWRIEGTFA
jgi:hypothetical protein